MPLTDNITEVKTVNNIYFTDVLGIFQHLTTEKLQKMLQYPPSEWKEQCIIEDVIIEKIPRTNDTKPIQRYQQIVERGGIKINSANAVGVNSSNIIVAEGTLTRHNNIGFLADERIGAQSQNGVKKSYGCYFDSGLSMCTIHIYQSAPSGTLYARWTMTNSVTGVHTNYQFHNVSWGDSDRDGTFNNSWDCADYNWYINGVLMGTYISPFELPCPVSNCSLSVLFSGKVFKDSQSMARYKTTGDDSGDIAKDPEPETPAEDRKTELFFKSTIYKRVDGVQKDVKVGESNITFVVQYKSNDGTENYPAIGQVAGYVNDFSPVNTSTWGNIKWKKSSNAKIVQIKVDYTGEDGVRHSQTFQPLNFQYNTKNYGFYESYQNGTIRYYSKYATNMRIYANESDIDSYLGGDPTIKPLYDGNTGKISPTDYIGDPVVYNTTDYTVDADMSSCWLLTKEQVDELAEVFTTGLTKEEGDDNTLINITKTCARSFMAQSEPIDAVVDLFWLPIDVTGFCTSEDDNMTFSYDRYGILNGAKTIIDGTGEAMTVAESNTLRIGDGIGKLFNPINNLSTNIGATIGSAGSTSEVINTYSGTTPAPSNE